MAHQHDGSAPPGTTLSADGPGVPPWARAAAWAGLLGVVAYVVAWWVAGAVRPAYDASEQAISELFAVGAPSPSRPLLVAGLVISGIAMMLMAPALHRCLPGRGRTGPALVALSGLGTVAVAAAPCSPGCPGAGATTIDAAHAVAAAVAYGALVSAPVAVAWRVRVADGRLALWSVTLGGLAVAGLLLHYLDVVGAAPGYQQRAFNTIADLWYVLVAVRLLRAPRSPARWAQALPSRSRPS